MQTPKKFFQKLLKELQYAPRVIINDKLGSYSAAKREIIPMIKHIQYKSTNNRAENSHQPMSERERRMRCFNSTGHTKRLLSTVGTISSFFKHGRHLLSAKNYRKIRRRRFANWTEVVDFDLFDA
jgi:putative transposase